MSASLSLSISVSLFIRRVYLRLSTSPWRTRVHISAAGFRPRGNIVFLFSERVKRATIATRLAIMSVNLPWRCRLPKEKISLTGRFVFLTSRGISAYAEFIIDAFQKPLPLTRYLKKEKQEGILSFRIIHASN